MARANDNSMDEEFVDTLSYDVEFYKVNLAPALKLASGGAAALGRALEELEVCTETLAQNLRSMCSISDMEEAMGTVKKVYKDTMAKFDLVEAKDTKDEHLAYVTKKQELAEKHKTVVKAARKAIRDSEEARAVAPPPSGGQALAQQNAGNMRSLGEDTLKPFKLTLEHSWAEFKIWEQSINNWFDQKGYTVQSCTIQQSHLLQVVNWDVHDIFFQIS